MRHLKKAMRLLRVQAFIGSSETIVSPILQAERKIELVMVRHVFSSCVFQPR
jgi:hypothetical protein